MYREYCHQKDSEDLVSAMETIQEAEVEFIKGVDSIQKYVNLIEAPEFLPINGLGPNPPRDENNGQPKPSGDNRRNQPDQHRDDSNKPASSGRGDDANMYNQVKDSVMGMFDIFRKIEQDAKDDYHQSMTATPGPSAEVVPAYATIERITDMKFPMNIIFFFKQLITWIKNLILVVIDKLTHGIRALFGMPNSKDDYLNKDDLKLNLTNVKSIERIGTPLQTMKVDSKTGTVAVPKLASLMYVPADQAAKYGINFGESAVLKEDETDGYGINSAPHRDGSQFQKPEISKQPIPVLMVDTTQDLAEMKEYMQHFFDLFDNAVGSNNEDLFRTEDLEIMLEMFKKMESDIQTGNVPTYQIGAQTIEGSAIDSEKMRDNLIRTKINTDNLKKAFQQTESQIQTLTKIITQKQLLAVSDMGVQYKFLSAATNEQLIKITEVLDARIEQAGEYENTLAEERVKYNDLVEEINKLRISYAAVSNVTYTSVYQRQINNLFESSKYMTQVVSLRLTTMTMYLQALRDLKDICINLNAVNTVNSGEPHRFEIGKFFSKSIKARKMYIK
jgi:hypothetical protein